MVCIHVQKGCSGTAWTFNVLRVSPKSHSEKKACWTDHWSSLCKPRGTSLKKVIRCNRLQSFRTPPPKYPPTFLPQHQNKTRIQRTTYKLLFLIVVIISMAELFLNFIFYETSVGGHGTCRHFWWLISIWLVQMGQIGKCSFWRERWQDDHPHMGWKISPVTGLAVWDLRQCWLLVVVGSRTG